MNTTVVDAQAALHKAETDLQQARREEARSRLANVRDEAQRIDRLLAEHESTLARLNGEEIAAEHKWAQAKSQLDAHLANEPQDVLTLESITLQWKQERDRLLDRQIKAAARWTDVQRARAVPEMEILKLRAVRDNLARLARNFEALARGEDFSAGFRGGVYGV